MSDSDSENSFDDIKPSAVSKEVKDLGFGSGSKFTLPTSDTRIRTQVSFGSSKGDDSESSGQESEEESSDGEWEEGMKQRAQPRRKSTHGSGGKSKPQRKSQPSRKHRTKGVRGRKSGGGGRKSNTNTQGSGRRTSNKQYARPNTAVKSKAQYEKALDEEDIDHGFIYKQKKQEIEHGHSPSQLFGAADDDDNVDIEFSRPNATEPHADNGIKISNFREATKITKHCKSQNLMKCLVKWSHPDDFDTPCIKVMPYKRIYPNPSNNYDSYPAGMVFEFKCPYFYPGGLAEVEKMQMKKVNDLYVQDKSGPEWKVLGWP